MRNARSFVALRRGNEQEDAMAEDKEKVVVEKTSGSIGGIIAAIALLIAVVAILHYFGMLPF